MTKTPWQLERRNTLVTGGTRGIGHAIASELVALGAKVTIVARKQAEAEALRHGGGAVVHAHAAGEPVLGKRAWLAAILGRTPMGRIAEPHEVATMVACLAMPAASYVTGQRIAVDGGMSIQGLPTVIA